MDKLFEQQVIDQMKVYKTAFEEGRKTGHKMGYSVGYLEGYKKGSNEARDIAIKVIKEA